MGQKVTRWVLYLMMKDGDWKEAKLSFFLHLVLFVGAGIHAFTIPMEMHRHDEDCPRRDVIMKYPWIVHCTLLVVHYLDMFYKPLWIVITHNVFIDSWNVWEGKYLCKERFWPVPDRIFIWINCSTRPITRRYINSAQYGYSCPYADQIPKIFTTYTEGLHR